MTKKDYELIARAVATLKDNEAKDRVIDALCYELYGDNSRFDALKFERACYGHSEQ